MSNIPLLLLDDLKDVQVVLNSIDVLLAALEQFANLINPKDLERIYIEVEKVDVDADRIAKGLFQSVTDSRFASTRLRMAQKSLRLSQMFFKVEGEKRKELQAQKEKPAIKSADIDRIEAEIKRYVEKKKGAAKSSAQAAGSLHTEMVQKLGKFRLLQIVKQNLMTASAVVIEAAQTNIDNANRKNPF